MGGRLQANMADACPICVDALSTADVVMTTTFYFRRPIQSLARTARVESVSALCRSPTVQYHAPRTPCSKTTTVSAFESAVSLPHNGHSSLSLLVLRCGRSGPAQSGTTAIFGASACVFVSVRLDSLITQLH